MTFRWVTLYVREFDRSLRFYHEVLGLPIDRQFGDGPRFAFLGAPDAPKVELIWDPGQELAEVGKGISFGFAVPDLEGLRERIRAICDAPLTGLISPNPQTTFCFVTDPDGYRVQLIQE